MSRSLLITINIITGLVVTALTIIALGISGMAEATQPLSSYFWLTLFAVWLVGLALQFKSRTRLIGLLITFLPIVYMVVSFLIEFL